MTPIKKPLSIKGLRIILGILADDVLESARRTHQIEGSEVEVAGSVSVKGKFNFDENDEFSFCGRVSAVASDAEDVAEIEVGEDSDVEWVGVASLESTFTIRVLVPPKIVKE